MRVERPFWALHPVPGGRHAAAWVSPEEFDFVVGRGFVLIDGQRASVDMEASERRDDCAFLRVWFLEPWVPPERGEMLRALVGPQLAASGQASRVSVR